MQRNPVFLPAPGRNGTKLKGHRRHCRDRGGDWRLAGGDAGCTQPQGSDCRVEPGDSVRRLCLLGAGSSQDELFGKRRSSERGSKRLLRCDAQRLRITPNAWTTRSKGRPRFWSTMPGENFTCQKTGNRHSTQFIATNAAGRSRRGPPAQPSSRLSCLKTLTRPSSGSRRAARSGTSSISFSTGRRGSLLARYNKEGA